MISISRSRLAESSEERTTGNAATVPASEWQLRRLSSARGGNSAILLPALFPPLTAGKTVSGVLTLDLVVFGKETGGPMGDIDAERVDRQVAQLYEAARKPE
jgi:hypothetical protein